MTNPEFKKKVFVYKVCSLTQRTLQTWSRISYKTDTISQLPFLYFFSFFYSITWQFVHKNVEWSLTFSSPSASWATSSFSFFVSLKGCESNEKNDEPSEENQPLSGHGNKGHTKEKGVKDHTWPYKAEQAWEQPKPWGVQENPRQATKKKKTQRTENKFNGNEI